VNNQSFIAKIFLIGRRVTALAFIVMLLVANFWFIFRFTGEAFPEWTHNLFFTCVFFVAVGFFMMLPGWLNPSKIRIESHEDSE
jgi:hypothetical protein